MSEKGFTVRLAARVDQYVAAMEAAKKATTNFSRETEQNLHKAGMAMQKVGSTSTKYVTVPIAAMAAASVASAVKWESAWAGVTKTVDGTAAQLAQLEQELRAMTKELPATHAEIAKVAETAGQLGVQTDSIAEFSRVMIDLGETTNLTSEEAATAIAQLMNVMQTVPSEVDNLGAALVDLGNNGASTERDIIMMAQRIAGAGKIIGLSEAEVLGLANALASVGIEAEAGGSAVSNILMDIGRAVATGGEDLEAFARVAGQSGTEFAAQWRADPAQAIVELIEGLARIDAAGGDVFGTLNALGQSDVRVSRALLTMATSGTLLRDSLDLAGQAWVDNTALQDEAAKRYETTAAKLEILRNKAVDMFIDIGEAALPTLEVLMSFASTVIEGFADLPGPVQAATIALLGLFAAVGPITSLGGTVIKNLDLIKVGLSKVGVSAGAASTALGVFGAVVAGAAVAYVAYQSFTAEQRKVAARAKEVAANLGDATAAAIANADATDKDRIAHLALSAALTGTGDDGRKLTEALGALGLTTEDALDVLVAIDKDPVDALKKLALQAGATGEEAERLAQKVNASEDPFWGVSEANLWLTDELKGTGRAMEELQDQSELVDLDAMIRGFLNSDAASSTLRQELLAQAEEMTGLKRTGTDLLPLYEQYTALLEENEGRLGTSANATTTAATAIELWIAALEQATVSASELSSFIDEQTTVFDALTAAAGLLADALDDVFGGPRDIEQAQQDWAAGMDALTESFKENGATLDLNTEKGRNNRDAIKDQVDNLDDYIVALVRAGASNEDAAAYGNLFREELISQLDQLGLTREEAEAYLATLGMTPENIETAVELANDAAAKQRLQDLLDEMDELDEGAAAEIQALIDNGQFDEAERRLQKLVDLAEKGARIPVGVGQTNTGRWGGVPESADGRYVDGPMLSLLGEDGDEVVLPLTRAQRMRELLADPRVGPKVLAALRGVRAFAAGGIVGRVISTGSSSSAPDKDRLMANRFEAGDLDAASYRAYLDSRLGTLTKYSDEWMAIWRQMNAVDEKSAQATRDQLAREDEIQRAMLETGAISASTYELYLKARLGAFEQYSADWMAAWRQLNELQRQEAADAEAAVKLAFDRAGAARDLAEAERDLAKALGESNDADAKAYLYAVDQNRSAEEKAQAIEAADRARERVAEVAFRGAGARAVNAGFATGTEDWARFVRREVEAYAADHPELAGLLGQLLQGVPQFAAGGMVRALPGVGTLARLGEGREDEYVFPRSKLVAFLGAYGAARQPAETTDSSPALWVDQLTVGSRDDLPATRDALDALAWRARIGR